MNSNIREKVTKLTPILIVIAIGIIISGILLQYKLNNIASHPQAVAYIGEERNLVQSLQGATLSLLNWNDDKKANESLRNMQTLLEKWKKNHLHLAEIAQNPKIELGISSKINHNVLPRYDSVVSSVEKILKLSQEKSALTLSEIKPLIKDVEYLTELYLFFLSHLDLQLANLGSEKIENMRNTEGLLVIVAGLILLIVLVFLYFPALGALTQYDQKINELVGELKEKNSQLSSLYFKVERKAEYINDCLQTLAHDIRNPLSTVKVCLALQRKKLNESDLVKKDAIEKISKTMEKNIHLSMTMLKDFLEMTKMDESQDKINPKTVNLKEFFERNFEQNLPGIKRRGLEYNLEIDKSCPGNFTTDTQKLDRVISNLLSNAAKYTDKGSVRLHVKPRDTDSNLPDMLQIEVKDSGIGIPEEYLDRIFTPFCTPNKREDTVGLGLTITRRLIDSLGGEISVKSSAGLGSTFKVMIPVKLVSGGECPLRNQQSLSTSENDDQVISALKANQTISGMSILLVEDNEDLRELTAKFLRSADLIIYTAATAKNALELLNSQKPHIDLVLMDLDLPDMDGISAFGKIREKGFQVPVIAITSYSTQYSKNKCLQAGFNGFMEKPITPVELSITLIQSVAKKEILLKEKKLS